MTRMKKTSSGKTLFVALLSLIFIPSAVLAAELRTENAPTIPAGETLAEDLYIFGGTVTLSGAIRADAVAGGGTVLVNGPVSGDVIAGGGTITIVSDIGDDVRTGGGTITIQGSVGGDVIAGGGQIAIAGSRVAGDVIAAGGSITIDAPVSGDVQVAGGEIRINAPVGGKLIVQAESITLGPKAAITGDFEYRSPKEATLEAGATIKGETKYTKSADVREAAKQGVVAFISVWIVAKMLMIFAGALFVAYVFQRYAAELVARTAAEPLSNFGKGLVFFIVTPIASVLLLFTVFALPFGILGLLLYVAAMIFGAMITPIVIGTIVHKFVFKPAEYEISWRTVLLGSVLYFLVGWIPFIGPLSIFVAMLIALGAAISIKAQVLREWR